MSALPALATVPLPLAANALAAPRAAAEAGGAILHVLPVARGAALLFGWHGARLPRQGSALLDHPGGRVRGLYRLHAWRRDDAGTAWFLAALQLREPDALPQDASLSLQLPERPPIPLGSLPAGATLPGALSQRLAAEAASQPGPLALFLAELCIAAPRAAPLQALLADFLRRAAEPDGVIEIVGQAQDTLLLQGWGRCEPGQPATALLTDNGVARHPVMLARFARPDIAPPAAGAVALLTDAAACNPATLGAVHLVCGPALYRREVLPARQLLDATHTAGHVRDILPVLACTPETEAALRRLLRPRFAGKDTLSALDRPVRAAVDFAAIFPGVGAFLSGWMVDPQREAESVALCGPEALSLRLDAGWARLMRPDVAQAFRADARFAALADGPPQLGFACFAPAPALPADAAGLHLELAVGDTPAFLPVTPSRGSAQALLRRALESIDLHQAGAHAAIAGQLGPMARALLRAGLGPPSAETIRAPRATPRRALLLPLPPAGPPAHAALSFLLADPLSPDEGLVLVAPSCWGERELAALERALPLYAPGAAVLRATAPCGWTEMLDLAARATEAEVLLCLGAGVLGRQPGWRAALAAHAGTEVVFPTALYEDDAVRSIGVSAIGRMPGPPWARVVRPGAGMPARAIPPARRPLVAGSLAGALVPRAAWQAAGGFAGGGLLAPAQELAFFRRLATAGFAFTHAPDVAVYAVADTPPGAPPRWQQAAALVDGWLLTTDEGVA